MRKFALALVITNLNAAVVLTKLDGRIEIAIDGKPFSTFYYGPEAPKPYLHPLRSASGKIVTRRFPMEEVPSDNKDRHHRGLWVGYKDINGFDFWENEFSYNNRNAGKVVMRGVNIVEGTIAGTFNWLAPSGETILEEQRTMSFRGDKATRVVDVDITLRSVGTTTFADSKDGFFAVRLTEALAENSSGTLTNSNGGRKMKETWGKQANWIDCSGELDGEKLGVAVFEHPSSFRSPPRWHVRDYGLLAANPFGSHAFDPDAALSKITLKPGDTVRLRHRVVIHSVLESGALEDLFRGYH
jgi:hypothetical protein